MSTDYAVIIEKFAESHYIKLFEKKYRKRWDVTLRAIVEELQRIEALIGQNAYIETLCELGETKLMKLEFKIAGTNESRHSSGNRCIVAVRTDIETAFVLLAYAKSDVRGQRETDWWKGLIRDNYPEYQSLV